MLIVKIGKKENINQALKRLKRKVRNSQILKEVRDRKQFLKPSAKKRLKKQKAVMTRKWIQENEQY